MPAPIVRLLSDQSLPANLASCQQEIPAVDRSNSSPLTSACDYFINLAVCCPVCGSGSAGSICFRASRIRIPHNFVQIRTASALTLLPLFRYHHSNFTLRFFSSFIIVSLLHWSSLHWLHCGGKEVFYSIFFCRCR